MEGIVADNCVKPGSPVYCWHTTVSERYKTTNYSLNEFLESTIEDWQVVCDYLGPLAGRKAVGDSGWRAYPTRDVR